MPREKQLAPTRVVAPITLRVQYKRGIERLQVEQSCTLAELRTRICELSGVTGGVDGVTLLVVEPTAHSVRELSGDPATTVVGSELQHGSLLRVRITASKRATSPSERATKRARPAREKKQAPTFLASGAADRIAAEVVLGVASRGNDSHGDRAHQQFAGARRREAVESGNVTLEPHGKKMDQARVTCPKLDDEVFVLLDRSEVEAVVNAVVRRVRTKSRLNYQTARQNLTYAALSESSPAFFWSVYALATEHSVQSHSRGKAEMQVLLTQLLDGEIEKVGEHGPPGMNI